MTGLTIEYGVPPARRHAARAAPRAGANAVAARAAAVTRPPSASLSARPNETKAKPGAWRVTGAIALAVAALHAGVALLAARAPAAPPVQPPRPLPMTVELTRPPEPLPQAAHPPPPAVPPKSLKQAPTPP
ncbi:energy transducer TonB, partial [Burkholderia contaminans]